MEELAGWIAPVATAIAAVMTASNLGARVTGWGFVVFTLGSIAWSIVAIATGQTNLLWSNGFLTLVNLVGIWRWLGRMARYQDDGRRAMAASVRARTPDLLTLNTMIDLCVRERDGAIVGSVVDGLLEADTGRLAAIVVRLGGIAGIGERLVAVERDRLALHRDRIALDMSAAEIGGLPDWVPEALPASIPRGPAPVQNVARKVAP